MSRVKNFVDGFEKGIKVLMDNAPAGLSYNIAIYCRDTNDRSEEDPDGKIETLMVKNGNTYDSIVFTQIVKDRFLLGELVDED